MSEIKLVLDGADTPQVPAVPENNKPVVTAEQVLSQVEQLSPEEKAQVEALAERIDLHKPEIVTNYGATVQKQSAAIATKTLQDVKTKNTGEVSDLLVQMVVAMDGMEGGKDQSSKATSSACRRTSPCSTRSMRKTGTPSRR